MDDPNAPPDFVPADFTPGFLDHGGPYFLAKGGEGPRRVGLRVMAHHINYKDAAHGGVISTFADVALSHAVYDAERPRLAPSTVSLVVNYLAGARLDDWLESEVTIDRMGGRTAYTSGRIVRVGKDGSREGISTMSGVFTIRRPAR